ncbi:MAG: bifunctional [glutamate--ammonia ligase]-adenylyl-L-tyrosine phosphorylase/[glutamate--ammonia-ligase] adenylyltransferase [Thermodesulfobacteriota bacterium]
MNGNILYIDEEKAAVTLESEGFKDAKRALKNLRLLSGYTLGKDITKIIGFTVLSPSADDALNNLEKIASTISNKTASFLLKEEKKLKMLITICGSSQMLSHYIVKNPTLLDELFVEDQTYSEKGLETLIEELNTRTKDIYDTDGIARALRLYRQREYLRIGSRDLLGLTSMVETTAALSALASATMEITVAICLRRLKEKYGTPFYIDNNGNKKEAAFVVIGMGKLGGMELNFSSDIDIMYIYSSNKGETTGTGEKGYNKINLHAFFVKLSEMITKLISGITEDGFVFRIDLDLRPEGKKGNIANSIRSAEIYYESWGKTWERAAMIKARPVAGSLALGEEFLLTLEPFVYRRYLDFTAIDEIRAMKEKIDLGSLGKKMRTVNVKLGVGGIREIEFFIQAIQLINGGKDKNIRQKNSLAALDALSNKGYLRMEDADRLAEAYVFLRNLEHKIQIVEGRQTHVIPAKTRDLQRVAKMMGFEDGLERKAGEALLYKHKKLTENVHEIYEMLFYKPSMEIAENLPDNMLILFSPDISEEEAIERLSKLGFKETSSAWERLKVLRDGPPFVYLPAKAQLLIDKIAPFFLSQIISSPDPDMALEHMEGFITAIGGRTAIYSLLAENKKILEVLVTLFSTSVFLSRGLIDHPEGVEVLFSDELNKPIKEDKELYKELNYSIGEMRDYEEKLDVIRRFRNSEVMRIGINDISGRLDPPSASRQLSLLADVCLGNAYELALDVLSSKHGKPSHPRFAIFGLGKLGGSGLTYSSDLDIIFIYSADSENTDGPKVISTHEFFAKLAQRIISILSILTKEGVVFKVDTRLRPSGSSGPLVSTKDAFLRYHRETAKIWEIQSMLKARFVCGDNTFAKDVLEEFQQIVYSRELGQSDLDELYRIRKRMEVEIARETSSRYNIKTGRGGLVDIEFIVQTLQLKYGNKDPFIRTPNTLEALEHLRLKEIVTKDDYDLLRDAYDLYTLLENRLRIVHNRPEGDIIKGSRELSSLARRLGYKGANASEELLKDYLSKAKRVRALYLNTVKQNPKS